MALQSTDLLFIQRVNSTSPTPEHYNSTISEFTDFVGANINVVISNLSTQVELHTEEISNINESLARIVSEVRLLQLEDVQIYSKLTAHDDRILKNEVDIDEIKNKAKANLYYRWKEELTGSNVSSLESGEMYAMFDDNADITELYYSTIDPDGIPVNQPFIFPGETIELTSAYDPLPDQPSKLRYRCVLLLENIDIQPSYIRLEVTEVHSFGDFPYHDEDNDNVITRTDFHPNSVDIELLAQEVRNQYLKLDGSNKMGGNFTMDRGSSSANINLISTNQSILNASKSLRITVANSYKASFDQDGIHFDSAVDAGGNKISNLDDPSSPNDAANKSYVDTVVSDFEVQLNEKFDPGEQVASESSSGVERGGFYMQSGTLYVKI